MRMNAETLRRAKALLENETPLKTDCGALCGAACCRTDADGKGGVAKMPLEICTAMSQGYIGYQLEAGLKQALAERRLPWQVATVLTQVTVSPDDPAFGNPTKPIGAF